VTLSARPREFRQQIVTTSDADTLADYKAAPARWLEWLDGDAEHSINGQLNQLFWQDAVFRSFNYARSLAGPGEARAAISPILAQFLDQGYVAAQVLGISKLVEKSDPKHPKKGVVSLCRLIDDIVLNAPLLTRANFLGLEGAPYDYEAVRRAAIEAQLAKSGGAVSFHWGDMDGADGWMRSELMHEQFDKLSGVRPEARAPDDGVSADLLKKLSAALDDPVFATILLLRHKTIAHAADAFSRSLVDDRRKGLTFHEVDQALQILLSVRQVVQAGVLYSSWRGSAVPTPQQDQFEHLASPFVDEAGHDALRAYWRDHCAERDAWLDKGWADFLP
jgi:hypothetical protein